MHDSVRDFSGYTVMYIYMYLICSAILMTGGLHVCCATVSQYIVDKHTNPRDHGIRRKHSMAFVSRTLLSSSSHLLSGADTITDSELLIIARSTRRTCMMTCSVALCTSRCQDTETHR